MKAGLPGLALAISLSLLFCSCGGYADFTLPVPAASPTATTFTLNFEPNPVLAHGSTGEWDSHDALNPSVVRHAGLFYNFYSGFDGATWRTGLATSADGRNWQKAGTILAPDPATWEGSYIAANGSALFRGGEFLYWYQAGPRESPRLGLARSPDGRRWTRLPAPVLPVGPRGSWDERGVADPYVLYVRNAYYLFYLGQDRARRQRLGVARSTDGVHWDKLRANPILELGGIGAFDENGLGEPAVWIGQGYYWMLYTGRDYQERRRLGLARSRDGVSWQKLPAVFAGREPWNSQVLCDPSIEALGDKLAVWFGGGDVPSPDENLHGQIGIGVLEPVGATLGR
ncbi:MAG TPA: hypothetical protein VG672_06470 [Bryobacteraceae bacterium]|nr:hypothetical protein [Bryobacteraceae bacterium]